MTDRDDAPERTPEERRADHAAIDRLADELLPALVAKLGASGLGELAVREGRWRVRLRMPGDGRAARRPASPGRSTSRLEGRAAAVGQPGPLPGGQPLPPAVAPASPGPATPAGSATPAGATARAAGHAGSEGTTGAADPGSSPTRVVATSPAVGFFQPRARLAAGARVRAGDPIGAIDVLGVPHEVVAPTDGIVGATVVAPGDPVEYGQPLLEIELLAPAPAPAAGTARAAEGA